MIVSSSSLIFHHLIEKKVTVQVSMFPGIPKIIISGLATRVVKESRDRIISSLKSQKIKLKSYRTVINLTPTDLVKNDNHLELAMIVAVLAGYGLLKIDQNDCYLGSMGLSGEVTSVPKIQALVLGAKKLGFKRIFLAESDLKKVVNISNLKIIGLSNIEQLISKKYQEVYSAVSRYSYKPKKFKYKLSNLFGNQGSIRVLQIAAAGNHHLLLTGPPGYGKTVTAHCIELIMPTLSDADMLEAMKVNSLAGNRETVVFTPPFRKISTSISLTKLVGNKTQGRVGELELANHGVLFMDEINLFKREVLDEVAYQLDDNLGQYEEKSKFLLIATNNPCKCGFFGTQIKKCSCSQQQLTNYQQKLSGALLDRLDLFFEVNETILETKDNNINDDLIINQVAEVAKQLSNSRRNDSKCFSNNGEHYLISTLSSQSRKLLEKAKENLKLSNRAILKVINVARTISLLDNSDSIKNSHLIEAISYRKR